MSIGFDNSSRLCRDTWYFKYREVPFKLIQNNCRKWSDVLLTILPGTRDGAAQDRVYAIASEFLSAVCWQNHSRVMMEPLGGMSCPDTFSLSNAKCQTFSFPRIAFPGKTSGHDISVLPQIETAEQRTALLLYRDAMSSNHGYLSFLFYWQILETKGSNPIQWVDEMIDAHLSELGLSSENGRDLPANGQSVGNYLNDDCRNAIAHIKRYPGKRELLLDSAADALRIARSTDLVRKLAEFYIRNNLSLTKRLHLVRTNGRGFPFYVDVDGPRTQSFKMAYKRLLPRF